jgi:hypothetical protein
MTLELEHLRLVALGSDLDKETKIRYFRASLQLLRLLRDEGCTPQEFEMLVSGQCAALRGKLVNDVRTQMIAAVSAHADGALSAGG